MGTIERIGIY